VIPFYVMLAAIAVARGLGALGWTPLAGWHAATRAGLCVLFLFTGIAHFTRTRNDLVRMVPPQFPNPALLVTLTGLAEIAGAIGLVVPATARVAASALIALLVVMLPANLYAARIGHTIRGRPHTPLIIRVPLQAVWIVLLWWSSGTI
jgi:uncharacterized membrane protein